MVVVSGPWMHVNPALVPADLKEPATDAGYPSDVVKPVCHDCLSGDVAVKLIDQFGFEHYFCAECDAGWQEFRERLAALLGDGCRQVIDQPGEITR